MISLYLTKTEHLPPREELLRRILFDVSAEKRDEWCRASEKRAVESLSGILLLQCGLELEEFSGAGAELRYEPTGRPFLQDCEVDFSISHAEGVTAVAMMRETEGRVGVDVERLQGRSQASMQRIAERWFTDGERELWREQPDEMLFLQIWTGKEALSKQRGCGLSGVASCDVTNLRESALNTYFADDIVVTLCAPLDAMLPNEAKWIAL